MKRFYIKLGLMCEFEDVSVGRSALMAIGGIGLSVFILVLVMAQ